MSAAPNSLAAALAQVFALREDRAFADGLVGLARDLTGAAALHLFVPEGEAATLLASSRAEGAEEFAALAGEALAAPEGQATSAEALAMGVALPSGAPAILVAATLGLGDMPRALCFERMTFLGQLARLHFAHPELDWAGRLATLASDLRGGQSEPMQRFADGLAALTGAGYAAAGWFDGQSITELAISGQGKAAKRAALPDQLRPVLAQAAQAGAEGPEFWSCLGVERRDGIVFALSAPRANVALIGAIAALVAQQAGARRGRKRRLPVRALSLLLIAGAALLVPIPDGVEIAAELRAAEHRSVTAPVSALLREAAVEEADAVVAGETVLARFDTREVELELVAAQAERSGLILKREAARGRRDAAELRAAELELERITARIDLLEARRRAAEVLAPISGVVFDSRLEALQGSILRQGEQLLQIAGQGGGMELHLQIPQREMGRIAVGARGAFRPDFDPALRLEAAIEEVSPAARASERAPIFTARGRVDLPEGGALRHGMSGVLILRRDWRPAGLTLWDGLRDWALLRMWF